MRKLTGLFRRKKIATELEEELRTHLEMKLSGAEDPQAARRQFGNVTLLLEDSRDVWRWPRIEDWWRDFQYALRGMMRNPGFALTVVLTLALGISATSTIFSLIDAVLIRPLPFPDSHRLVSIQEAQPSDPRSRTPVAPGRLEDWQRITGAFEAIAGSQTDPVIDTTDAAPQRLSSATISPRFFSVLDVRPALGRVFTPEEEAFGGPLAVVISDGLWRRRFGADPGILTRSLILAGRSYRIAGVMPASFQYPTPEIDVWIPKQIRPAVLAVREARFYKTIGRLKPDITLEQAQADLQLAQRRLGEQYPKTDAGWGVAVSSLKEALVGKVALALWLLLGSVSLLLLIACANVACLMLARLNSRSVEIATRCSLGAGRAVIARQLFVEGLAYALVGGAIGLAVAAVSIDLLRKEVPDIPRIAELEVDPRTLLLVTGISVLAAVLSSLAPMLQAFRRDLSPSLIQGGRALAGTRQRLPRFLVSAQLALATVLLIGAGLFLRSLIRIQEAPLGFHPESVLALRVVSNSGESPDAAVQRHRRTLDALSTLPGVTSVAMASGLPGVNPVWPREFEIAGQQEPNGTLRFTGWRIVTDAYFRTVGLAIREGESCRMSTDPKQPFQTLVNRSFADRYFPGKSPIGETIRGGPMGDTASRVVGVVADAREDGQGSEPRPMVYACGFLRYWPDSEILVQTRNPESMIGEVRAAMSRIEPSRPVYLARPLTEAMRDALAQTRFRALLVGLFSAMALTLATIGLYGVTAYMVAQRTREIGIRIALGARPSQIVGEILRSGGVLAGAGALVGLALAAVASRLLGALLYGIRSSDAVTYLSAVGVLFGVALLACLMPSKRASSIDPNQALRF